mmetsp:Transcript_20272/g.44268  ORF Transcript_20272/g.44268 Transcript_20272/m.44268 type:complete len:244 (-) Transcript_20272:102-833(-)
MAFAIVGGALVRLCIMSLGPQHLHQCRELLRDGHSGAGIAGCLGFRAASKQLDHRAKKVQTLLQRQSLLLQLLALANGFANGVEDASELRVAGAAGLAFRGLPRGVPMRIRHIPRMVQVLVPLGPVSLGQILFIALALALTVSVCPAVCLAVRLHVQSCEGFDEFAGLQGEMLPEGGPGDFQEVVADEVLELFIVFCSLFVQRSKHLRGRGCERLGFREACSFGHLVSQSCHCIRSGLAAGLR